MKGENTLQELIKGMTPELHKGEYVFSTLKDSSKISREDIICEFKEKEGTTIVLLKEKADALGLAYEFIASWITLNIHSALDAVGLTAVIATELTKYTISCNVISGYYHDHIFVNKNKANKALEVLLNLSKNYRP